MTARTSRQQTASTTTHAGRRVPSGSAVTNVVVRVAGTVPVRLDLTQVGTMEQQLGLSLGTVLIYLRSGITARAIADGWEPAAVLTGTLSPAITGRRSVPVVTSVAAVMVQMAAIPPVRAAFQPAREDGTVPAVLRVQVGPVTWEVCDANAYVSLLRAWRQAAHLLSHAPVDDQD